MSRRLDWDRLRRPRIVSWVPEVTDEVPDILGPEGARSEFMKAVVAAVGRGRPLPQPSPLFLRYFNAKTADRNIDEWLSAQPEYRAAINRRDRAKKLNRDRYLAKLAGIEGAFREPPLPPTSLGEVDEPAPTVWWKPKQKFHRAKLYL